MVSPEQSPNRSLLTPDQLCCVSSSCPVSCTQGSVLDPIWHPREFLPTLTSPRPVVLSQGILAPLPLGMVESIWRRLWLSGLEEQVLLASSG